MNENKTLIIGASSSIGSLIFKNNIDRKKNYYGTYRSTESLVKYNINDDNYRKKLFKCDLKNKFWWEEIKIEFDNLIICASNDESENINLDALFALNFIGAKNIFNYLLTQNSISKIINLSSTSVFGNPQETYVNSKTLCNPISIYGVSKLFFELLLDRKELSHIKKISIRMPMVGGKYSHKTWLTRLINKSKDNYPRYYFNGDQKFNNIITDNSLIDFIDLIINCNSILKGAHKRVVLGSSDPITVNEIVGEITKRINYSYKLIESKNHKMPNNWLINVEEAKELGYKSLSVKDSINYFLDNYLGY